MALSGVGASLATSLLEQTGSDWAYSRGPETATIRLYKNDLQPIVIMSSEGQEIEALVASFRGLASEVNAAFGNPERGDRIASGELIYEVQPIYDKCFYQVGGMIHIHAKKVKS